MSRPRDEVEEEARLLPFGVLPVAPEDDRSDPLGRLLGGALDEGAFGLVARLLLRLLLERA